MIKLLPMLAISGLFAATSSTAFGQSDARAVVEQGAVPGLGVETKSEVVRYADLNLKDPNEAATMVNRINHAAKDVCAPEPVNPIDAMEHDDYRVCTRDAASRAVGSLDAPAVTYAYKRRSEPR